jgi:hypothetical protein
MAGNSYSSWDGGAEFIRTLQQHRADLQGFLAQHSDAERQQMAAGLAQYLATAIGKDPNDPPSGLSETLDNLRSGKEQGNKIAGALKGIKNDFYNLFDKHPNVMLTTGGIIGLGGGLSLLKHYGLDQGTVGGRITSIGNLLFQSEKAVTLSTGPARKKMDAVDESLSGKLADVFNGTVPDDARMPEGMDPNSPEGKMVVTSGKAMSGVFKGMVKHREMLISNILVAGETFQTGGFITNAFLDKKHIDSISPEMHKAEVRTAQGGMVNAASNTLLMGLTYYNQYIDPQMQGLDASSPTYAQDKAEAWAKAPKQHMFAPGRACARVVGAMPEKLRAMVPNIAIGCSFLPLAGMVKEGMTAKAPLQLFGSLAVMAAVVLNYTAITNRSKGQKVLKPDEVTQFAELLAESAADAKNTDAASRQATAESLKKVLLGQSVISPEHAGLVEQVLAARFDLPFTAVRDHSRHMPLSRDPAVLASDHVVAKAAQTIGASEADITPEGISLLFKDAPDATKQAIDAINELAQNGGSHVAKSLGVLPSQTLPDGRVQLTMPLRALPAVTQAVRKLAEQPNQPKEQCLETVKQALQAAPQAMHLAQAQARGAGTTVQR